MLSKVSLIAMFALSVAVFVAENSGSSAFARGGASRGSRSVSRATSVRGPSTSSYRSSASFSSGGWHGSPSNSGPQAKQLATQLPSQAFPSKPSLNTATASQVMQTFNLQPIIGPPDQGPTSHKGPGRWAFNLGDGASKTPHTSTPQKVGVGPGANLGSSDSKTSQTSNLVRIPVKQHAFNTRGLKAPAQGLPATSVQSHVNEQTIPRSNAYKVNWKKPPHIFGGGVWHPWWERL
jgi:hypothetical protein